MKYMSVWGLTHQLNAPAGDHWVARSNEGDRARRIVAADHRALALLRVEDHDRARGSLSGAEGFEFFPIDHYGWVATLRKLLIF